MALARASSLMESESLQREAANMSITSAVTRAIARALTQRYIDDVRHNPNAY